MNCQLLSMNSTNETLLFVRFLILCDLSCFHLYLLHYLYCMVHMCDLSYMLNPYLLRTRKSILDRPIRNEDSLIIVAERGSLTPDEQFKPWFHVKIKVF